MPYASAAAFFRDAHGKRVVKTIEGALTVERYPAARDDIIRQLTEQNCPADKIVEDDTGLRWPGGFLMMPKEHDREEGTMTVRSADYLFQADIRDRPVFGDKKGATVEGDALVKRYPNGRTIRFEVAK